MRNHEGALRAPVTNVTKKIFCLRVLSVVAILLVAANSTLAQPLDRLTFQQAIDRAVANNPTVASATEGILRAEALLQQVRSSSLPNFSLTSAVNFTNPVRFDVEGRTATVVPGIQTQTSPLLGVPILTPVAWAQRNRAGDQIVVAQQNERDIKRQIAVAAGQSYLAIIARRRVLDLNSRARDNARAHYEFANQRFQGGIGSRLNMLRAEQEMLSDETRVEEALLLIQAAQEALGVFVGTNGPVDATDYPNFIIPDELGQITNRTDM